METINRQDLFQKIDQLFVYRQIPWMLQLAGMKQPRRFYGKLKELQAAIYDLDHTLESNWKVEPSALQENWGTINDHLEGCCCRDKGRFHAGNLAYFSAMFGFECR